MPEDYEEFISLTLRTRNSRKPLGVLESNWKHRWLLLCLARQARRVSMERPVVRPMISNQNLRVSWKPVNLQDCVWKNLYRIIMRTILQEKETIHCNIKIWCTNLFLCPKPWRFPQQKQSVDKEWEKLWKISAWDLTKVRSKKEVIDEARTKGAKVHFASLVDICHLKNAQLEAKHQKYKGRVVLRGDIVKDDSGSYAVFTEQGSSASQMTAAKVMDIISRLSGCAAQAADAVSAYIQAEKWKTFRNKWTFPNRNVQTYGFVYHDTNGLNHGPVWEIRSFLLSEICTVILWQDCYGKGNLSKSYWNTVWWRFPIGTAYLYTVKKGYSYLYMWMT